MFLYDVVVNFSYAREPLNYQRAVQAGENLRSLGSALRALGCGRGPGWSSRSLSRSWPWLGPVWPWSAGGPTCAHTHKHPLPDLSKVVLWRLPAW